MVRAFLVITECSEDPNAALNWRKPFGLSNAFYVPVTEEGKNTGRATTKEFWKKLTAGAAETLEGYGTKLAL